MSEPAPSGSSPSDVERPAPAPEAAAPSPAAPEAPSHGDAEDGAQGTPELDADGVPVRRRRRGSRGGRNRSRARSEAAGDDADEVDGDDGVLEADGGVGGRAARPAADDVVVGSPDEPAARTMAPRTAAAPRAGGPAGDRMPDELPERPNEGRPSVEAAERALVRRPQIGDTRPAPSDAAVAAPADAPGDAAAEGGEAGGARRRRGGRGRSGGGGAGGTATPGAEPGAEPVAAGPGRGAPQPKGRSGGRGAGAAPDEGKARGEAKGKRRSVVSAEVDLEAAERRKGRERNGRPVGRYLMAVHVHPDQTQIAVLEGRSLIEHYVSRPADDVGQIHGNIYLGKVQNVLPGMEAAFVDIGTPKNAVLYRGDVQYEQEDILDRGSAANLRIEQMLKVRQTILCQVVKNPIGAKGARLTQEVSLPGRFVVLIPNSSTYGISKRLPDDERKRLRSVLDKVKPAEHGVIVRTAAENVTGEEIQRDVLRLLAQWEQIDRMAKQAKAPALLHREPDMAVRVIREEFNPSYRGVLIDDRALFEDVKDYVTSISPELADRVEYYDPEAEGLPLFERNHVHEQLHKALDRKVWLPSGGSLIIEHTEALTVIDVNTGKNVGTSNLEETVFRNNLEAAEEIARQLRLRDIGGIIVIDFIDMEIKDNRQQVIGAFRSALARDKTRTQVFDISELGLVEMTRKRIGEGLLTSFASPCPHCEGRGVIVDHSIIGEP